MTDHECRNEERLIAAEAWFEILIWFCKVGIGFLVVELAARRLWPELKPIVWTLLKTLAGRDWAL